MYFVSLCRGIMPNWDRYQAYQMLSTLSAWSHRQTSRSPMIGAPDYSVLWAPALGSSWLISLAGWTGSGLARALWFPGSRNHRRNRGLGQQKSNLLLNMECHIMDCYLSGVLFSWERAGIVLCVRPPEGHFTQHIIPPSQTMQACRNISPRSWQKKLWSSFYFPLNTEPSRFWMTSVREVISCFANSVNITLIGNM